MKKSCSQTQTLILLTILIIGTACDGQAQNDLPKEKVSEPKKLAAKRPKTVPFSWGLSTGMSYDKFIDTRYEYADPNGKQLVIENSLPKGGLKYTDPNGQEYVYAVFWTRIANETANPFEWSIDFSEDTYKLPSSPNNYFKIVLPFEQMTIDKTPLFNYGLTDLDAILDEKLRNSASLQKTINSKATSSIYVVILTEQGIDGTIRAGFSLKDDKLYYRVNDKEIYCGQSNIKSLKPQK
jgi:hypothetical protein